MPQRVITAGLDGERIDPADLLSVRTCGRRLVENQKAAAMNLAPSLGQPRRVQAACTCALARTPLMHTRLNPVHAPPVPQLSLADSLRCFPPARRSLLYDGDDSLGSSGGDVRKQMNREFASVIHRTIVTERDLILARSMQEAVRMASHRAPRRAGASHPIAVWKWKGLTGCRLCGWIDYSWRRGSTLNGWWRWSGRAICQGLKPCGMSARPPSL